MDVRTIISLRLLFEKLTIDTLVKFLLLKNIGIDFSVEVVSPDGFLEERVICLIFIQSPLGALAQAEGFRALSHSARNQGFGAQAWSRRVSIHGPVRGRFRLLAKGLLKDKSFFLNARILVQSMTLNSWFCLQRLLILELVLFLLDMIYPRKHSVEFTVFHHLSVRKY